MGKAGENSEIIRIWVDGCFDMGHFGHVNLLRQAKVSSIIHGKQNYLVVGVHSDAEIAQHKRLPIFTETERLEMVESCKYVDKVVPNAPYITTVSTLDAHNCQFTVHGSDLSTSALGTDTYEEVKSAEKYFEVDRTEGISTTNLIKRVLNDVKTTAKGYTGARITNEAKYYTDLMKKIQNVEVTGNGDTEKVIYVEGSFDLYHPGHVRFLKEAKQKGTYLVVNVYDDPTVKELSGSMPYMKLHERALTLMGCRYVDEVIIGGDYSQISRETERKFENIEIYPGLDAIEHGLPLGDIQEVTTDSIIQRIMDRQEELTSKNAKKEAKEEVLANNLMKTLKIV